MLKFLLKIPSYCIAAVWVGLIAILATCLFPLALATFQLDAMDKLKYPSLLKRRKK